MKYAELRILDRLAGEVGIVSHLITSIGKTDTEKDQHILNYISHKDFTILELYSKAPRYLRGSKIYAEYFLDITPNGSYLGRAVRKEWEDIIEARMVALLVDGADNSTGKVIVTGDFTKEIEAGATHTILSSLQVPKGQATVQSVVFNAGNTEITYNDITGVVSGDILYFQKGNRLVGVNINISWYNKDDSIGIYKTVERRFTIAEAASYEYSRRERSMQHMIAESDGTPVAPFIKAIIDNYADKIENYVNLGHAQEFKEAIDNEVDPVINAYLDIPITIVDIEGNAVTAQVRDMIKNELYLGYKQ